MPINIISKIKPKNDGLFPTFEDRDIVGGYQVRSDTTDRNSIPSLNRKEGMLVYVQGDDKYYTLDGGTTDGYWTEVVFGGSAQDFTLVTTAISYEVPTGENQFVYVEGGGVTITLPSLPADNQEVIIKDGNGVGTGIIIVSDKSINFCTISGEGYFLDYEYACLHIRYNATTDCWHPISYYYTLPD
jgi:hypothetical protein